MTSEGLAFFKGENWNRQAPLCIEANVTAGGCTHPTVASSEIHPDPRGIH